MSCVRNVAQKAVWMRFDLHGNGVGDQVDQRCGEVQIDGWVEIVFVLCRDARGLDGGFKADRRRAVENRPLLS